MPRYCTLKLKIFLLLLFLFFLLIAYNLPLNATIRYVSKTGNSTPPYLTWETAADSIQKCINICVFGDTIYVANGVYEEQVVMVDGLSLIGTGTDSCIVDSRNFPPQGFHAVEIADSCLIKGFYIRTSNNFDYGYGVYTLGQTGMITENKFSNANTGIYLYNTKINAYKNYFFNVRRGITTANSNSVVRKNDIFTLTETGAGETGIFITAFYNDYYPIIDSNYIETISRGIDKDIGSNPTIKNNAIILFALSASGIFLSSSDSAKVYNNLIYAKQRSANYGIQNNGITYLQLYSNYVTGYFDSFQNFVVTVGPYNTVKNNVVTKALSGVEAVGTQGLIFQNNNVWNNGRNYSGFTPDITNISVDPMIVNDDSTQGDLDLHLQMFSPLIDSGDPNILDKDGTRSDIGLYGGPYGESYIYVDLPPRPPVNLIANVDSLIQLNWNKNTEADFSYYNVYRDTTFDFTLDSTKLISSVADTFYYHTFPSNVETLYYKLTAVDNQGNESSPSEQVSVKLVSVSNEWVSVNDYILYQNYPNPFNPSTKIGYKLKKRGYVKLYVYDIKGELVSVLVNEVQEAGYYEIEFDTGSRIPDTGIRNLASGVYIYQIFVKGENNIPVFSDIKKMVYVK
jgi:hypothetical protein